MECSISSILYRKDMTNAYSKAKDEVKHEAAEVLKIYKQVNFSGPPLGLLLSNFSLCLMC